MALPFHFLAHLDGKEGSPLVWALVARTMTSSLPRASGSDVSYSTGNLSTRQRDASLEPTIRSSGRLRPQASGQDRPVNVVVLLREAFVALNELVIERLARSVARRGALRPRRGVSVPR